MKKIDIEDPTQNKYQENNHHTKVTSGQSKCPTIDSSPQSLVT